MAKKFFLVSLGILALTLAYQVGVRTAVAAVSYTPGAPAEKTSWDPESSLAIVGGEDRIWWTAAGNAWYLSKGGEWLQVREMDLPVPIGEVRFLTSSVLVTTEGEVWHAPFGVWEKAKPFPV
jgi:hypothetical protein